MTELPFLRVEDLTKSYSSQRRRLWRPSTQFRALDGVSLGIARGETVGLVGESGSGKSTLAGIVTRLIEADSGSVNFAGLDILSMRRAELQRLRQRIQMVFQNPYGSLNPRLPIGRAIAEPAIIHNTFGNGSPEKYATELLERVGLSGSMASRLPRELSGGQRQRVAIARSLAVRPELLIADEAVSALDLPVQAQILNLLESLRVDLGISVLFISHQLPVVAHMADRVAVMYLGRIVEVGPAEDIFSRPAHPYTVSLLAAQPGLHRRDVRHPPREPRSEASITELQARGCRFRDRCPAATTLCSEEPPPTARVAPRHFVECHYPIRARTEAINSQAAETASRPQAART